MIAIQPIRGLLAPSSTLRWPIIQIVAVIHVHVSLGTHPNFVGQVILIKTCNILNELDVGIGKRLLIVVMVGAVLVLQLLNIARPSIRQLIQEIQLQRFLLWFYLMLIIASAALVEGCYEVLGQRRVRRCRELPLFLERLHLIRWAGNLLCVVRLTVMLPIIIVTACLFVEALPLLLRLEERHLSLAHGRYML